MAAIPTESSYGLGALPDHETGVEAIYRMKERQRGKPLPVVVGDRSQLELLGIDSRSRAIAGAAAVWPAPLSVIVPVSRPVAAAAGRGTLAVRIPGHRRLRELLVELGSPLTATSANRAGRKPVLDPAELESALPGWEGWIVDDGQLPGGLPSTMVIREGDGWKVVRSGAVSPDSLPEVGA